MQTTTSAYNFVTNIYTIIIPKLSFLTCIFLQFVQSCKNLPGVI